MAGIDCYWLVASPLFSPPSPSLPADFSGCATIFVYKPMSARFPFLCIGGKSMWPWAWPIRTSYSLSHDHCRKWTGLCLQGEETKMLMGSGAARLG